MNRKTPVTPPMPQVKALDASQLKKVIGGDTALPLLKTRH